MLRSLLCKFETCENTFTTKYVKQMYCNSDLCKQTRERERFRIRREKEKLQTAERRQRKAQRLAQENLRTQPHT